MDVSKSIVGNHFDSFVSPILCSDSDLCTSGPSRVCWVWDLSNSRVIAVIDKTGIIVTFRNRVSFLFMTI